MKQTGSLNRKAIFWHYPDYTSDCPSNCLVDPYSFVRSGDWKLIENLATHELELYNLRHDIGEQHNLATEKPEKRDEMYILLRKWQKQAKVKFPIPNPNFISER